MPKRKKSSDSSGEANDANGRISSTINTFPCSSNGLVIMLLFPGERYCFYGAARIQCLAGDLVVDRFHMPTGGSLDFGSMHLVCAPYRLSRPAVFYSPAADKVPVKYNLHRLKYRLKEITSHYDRIMEAVAEKYPAVVVIDEKPSQTVRVLDQLFQEFFVPTRLRSSCHFNRTLFFTSDYEPYTEFSEIFLQEAMEKIDTMRSRSLLTLQQLHGRM